MDFTELNIRYLKERIDHKRIMWACWKCNCYECPFEKPCKDNEGNPKSFYKLAIDKVEELESIDS